MKLTIKEVSWHRNGIGGEGFHAVYFHYSEPGEEPKKMLAILFDDPGQCAVIQLDQPGEFTVQFGRNSWRGDHFETQLRKAIKTHKSSGSIRVGPFGIPT